MRLFEKLKVAYYTGKIKRVSKALNSIDKIMTGAGYNRAKRRQFWSKVIKARKDV